MKLKLKDKLPLISINWRTRQRWIFLLLLGFALNLIIHPISNRYEAKINRDYFGNKRYQSVFVIEQGSQELIGSFYKDEIYPGLDFFNQNLQLVKQYKYPNKQVFTIQDFKKEHFQNMPLSEIFPSEDWQIKDRSDHDFETLDLNLKFSDPIMPYGFLLDRNGNKKLKIIPKLDGYGFLILNQNNKLRSTIELPEVHGFQKLNFTQIRSNTNLPDLVVQGQFQLYTMSIKPNLTYYSRFAIRPGIFVLLFLFIKIIEFLQIRQIKQNEAKQEQLMNLQLVSINNQIDPHFTYNILSTVTSFDWQKDNQDDIKTFIYNSLNLFRSQLQFSNKTSISIQQEMLFVQDYVRIQQFRFSKIELRTNIHPSINPEIQIPKTIIFVHVENAVKHGLRPKPEGGFVSVEVNPHQKGIEIKITDNGIGIQAAKKESTNGSGTGLRSIDQIIDLFSSLNKTKITQEFIDLSETQGTQVKITILLK